MFGVYETDRPHNYDCLALVPEDNKKYQYNGGITLNTHNMDVNDFKKWLDEIDAGK
jgi:hypothetical protein